MSDLPTDLSAMLEAVEKYMGEQFTDMLDSEIRKDNLRFFYKGWDLGSKVPYPETV